MMLLLEFFAEPFWYRLGLTLAHFLWQGAIVTILVGAVVGLFKVGRGNAQYAAYLLAFVVMTTCPIATFIVVHVPSKPVITPVEMMNIAPRLVTEKAPPANGSSPVAEGTAPSITREIAEIDSAGIRRIISDYVHMGIPTAMVAWSIGVLVLSVRLLLGLIGVCRWRRNLEPLPAILAKRIGSLCERLGMEDFSHVFISPSAIQAMAIGYLRPMILLPPALMMDMQPEMLEAVIAHELAHIRRLDLWVNLLQRIVETLLFFHPAVWWLSHRMQAERELCCDELAVKATGEPLTYAATLESAAKTTFALRQPALVGGFGNDERATLNRVRHILGLAPVPRSVRSWLAGIVTITFMSALAVPFGLIRHTTEGSIAVSTLAGLRMASHESHPTKKITDRFEFRFDRAKYAASISSTRNREARPLPGSEMESAEQQTLSMLLRRVTSNPPLSAPHPAEGMILREKWAMLSWKARSDALSYDVYLGDCFEDVNNGASDTLRGNQTATFLIIGFPGFAYPKGLVPGTTYYWRIDDICEADPNNPWKGEIRNFSIAPGTAHNTIPAGGAEFVDSTIKLFRMKGSDAKLHRVNVGNDLDTVTNETDGRPQGIRIFTPSARIGETLHLLPSIPHPGDKTILREKWTILSWKVKSDALSYDVYLGDCFEDVNNGAHGTFRGNQTAAFLVVGFPGFVYPKGLVSGTTYYWRVDEISETDPNNPRKGDVRSFSIARKNAPHGQEALRITDDNTRQRRK